MDHWMVETDVPEHQEKHWTGSRNPGFCFWLSQQLTL